jgi:tetratricopeptide (TPR) repeat protein
MNSFNKAIEINPNNSNAWVNKAYLLERLNRNEEALLAYDKAIEINPKNSKERNSRDFRYEKSIAYSNKAQLLSELQRYEEALTTYNKAIEINPNNSNAWDNKASLLERLNRNEEALATFDEAIKVSPNDYDIWISKGSFLRNLERFEEALSAYDKAINIDSNKSTAWTNKAYLFEQLGRFEEALAAFKKSNGENPTNYSWKHIAFLCQKLERNEDALVAINNAIELYQQDEDAWNEKGKILVTMGRYEDAILAFDKAIEINPIFYSAWYNRRETIVKLEEFLKTIKVDFYAEPSTGRIMNRLELDIKSFFPINSTINISNNIQLNYNFEGQTRIEKFILSNSSYFGKIKVDLNQQGDFPFEDYNATIFLYYDYKNQSKPFEYLNSTNNSLIMDSWGQPRLINFYFEGNKIEITMERVNKNVTKWLYCVGVAIILAYLISFLIIYRKTAYNSDMFAVFNSFSFLFFVALVIAGVRDYIFISKYATGFLFLVIISFCIIIIKRFRSVKKINEMKHEEEIHITKIIEMLKLNDDKINEIKEMLTTENKKNH